MASNAAKGVTPVQEQFFHATNAAAVEGVVEAIESQVERLLPEGISKSARNRVVGEIYRELDSTLRANRTLMQQMRDAFRSGALDGNHQKAVVSLITGRARQALPAVAKRVLNEWTTTVVSANQQPANANALLKVVWISAEPAEQGMKDATRWARAK
jgi:DNA-binding FadR family transcriptional regulator